MAYRFIQENKKRYTIKETAGLLGVSWTAYYKWARKGISQRRQQADGELVRLIKEIVEKHCKRYGSPRVGKALNKLGIRVSLKKAARLMRENGLNARRKRKYIRTADSRHCFPVFENILNRDFHAEKPGQKRVSDITYPRTNEGWLYLAAVVDLCDRKVIGWSFSEGMEAEQTAIAALQTAVKNRTP